MNYLSFDKRALALMRMCIAFVLMLDLGIRVTDLEAFYSDSGVLPLPVMYENAWNPFYISIHTLSGLWQVQLLLFIFAFLCAVFLFIGYRTTLFTFLSWFMLLSLHNRNVMILQGGDDLLRMTLFWAMFIPWGAYYSCDALQENKNEPVTTRSVACIAYLLQIVYLYSGSALLKGQEWNHDFTALYYTYSLDQIAYPVTKYLFYHPGLLKVMTAIAWYFELLVPLLFFIPVKHNFSRIAGVLAIIFFHLFNSMTLFIGLFPLIGIATILGLLPSPAMNWLEKKSALLRQKIRLSFSGWKNMLQPILRPEKKSRQRPVFLRRIQTALLIFLTLFVFDWNLSNLDFIKSRMPQRLRFIGYTLRLDQNWGMFAPNVFKDDGWFILEGVTKNGEHFDLFHPDKKISYEKPADLTSFFKNDRWRKYTENYIFSENAWMRGYYCNYCKRIWNEENPNRHIVSLQVIFMGDFSLPDYKHSQAEKNILWESVE